MVEPERVTLPQAGEGLANYVQRLRQQQLLTQKELSAGAGVHIQTIRKIETGCTARLNQKARGGLAIALGIPVEYLDAAVKKIAIEPITALKFCPQCWTPGSNPDRMWTDLRSKYCFACGTALRDRCLNCHEPIMSLKFKFCPYCGSNYRPESHSTQPPNRR